MPTDRAEQQRHLDAWRASGLSRAAYCRQQDIPQARMAYWAKTERDRAERQARPVDSDDTTGFIEVTQESTTATSASLIERAAVAPEPLILRFPSGHELHLPGSVTPDAVAELTAKVCQC